MGRHSDIDFSEDLVAMATNYREFLRNLDPYVQTLLKPHVLASIVRRYETLWLPLKQRYPDVQVLPPRDVYWIWHVHMLSPVSYHGDCQKLIQCIPDHRFIEDYDTALQKGQEVWHGLYPEETFDLNPKGFRKDFVYHPQCSYDLVSAAQREAGYYYNISLPHFADVAFLTDAFIRYKKFLWLKKNEPDLHLDLLHAFDVDLIWRGHMMRPLLYKKETTDILGDVSDYNSEKLFSLSPSESQASVLKAWRFHFREELFVPGCRYRGPDPRHTVREMPQNKWKAVIGGEHLRFKIEPEMFKPETVLGQNCSKVFGPISLGFVPPDAEIHVDKTQHRVTDQHGNLLFTLGIIHTVDVHLSVLQVIHEGALVAMSHVIGHEQLVTEDQTGPNGGSVTIDSMSGERAMLVKTARGDEFIVKGGWKGYVQGDDFRNPQEKGALELSIIKLNGDTNDINFVNVSPFPVDDAQAFCLEGVEIDMNTGTIVISDPSEEPSDVLGQLCTALSALLVYMLCEPRIEDGPMGIEELSRDEPPEGSSGQNPEGGADGHGGDAETQEFKRPCKLAGCKMLKILGLGAEVPTNNWFFWLFHRRIPEVYCPWEPDRCHKIIQEQLHLSQMDQNSPPNQALWIMLISIIILLITVIATLLFVYYDYELPF